MVEVPRSLEQMAPEEDRRFVVHGVSWAQYETVREALDQVSGLRLTFLDGNLELMSPGHRHEGVKTMLARLLEAYALERGVQLNGCGGLTMRARRLERALEPDECYCLGRPFAEPPDLALEVVVTSWSLDRFAVYEGLGVREVWVWRDGRLTVYRLGPQGYAAQPRSELIPELDLDLLASFATDAEDQTAAVRAYLGRLRR
ncbi:MAG TPA: Uma2 family endonuclease [Polyangia bacterium]|jgi:Uma2 family endonuclease